MSGIKNKASLWLSVSVLIGGLMAALIIFMLYRIDRDLDSLNERSNTENTNIEKGIR